MGCVQTKGSSCSPQPSTLARLKLNNVYVKVETSGRQGRSGEAAELAGSGGERRISRESERKHGGGNFTQRISVKKIVAVDETVDGWPIWLFENVKGDVLAGLVAKSADSSAGNGNGNQLKQHIVGAEIIEQRPPPVTSAIADSRGFPISPQPGREDRGTSECAEKHKKLSSASRLLNRSCESPQGEQLQPLPPFDLSHRFQRPRSREDLEAFRIRRQWR